MTADSSGAGALGRQGQRTPLHAAALSGHAEAAKLLVEAKADVDARNKVSTQPLRGDVQGRVLTWRTSG